MLQRIESMAALMTAGGNIYNNNNNIFDGNHGHDVDDNDSDDGIKNFVPTRSSI